MLKCVLQEQDRLARFLPGNVVSRQGAHEVDPRRFGHLPQSADVLLCRALAAVRFGLYFFPSREKFAFSLLQHSARFGNQVTGQHPVLVRALSCHFLEADHVDAAVAEVEPDRLTIDGQPRSKHLRKVAPKNVTHTVTKSLALSLDREARRELLSECRTLYP